ncbi:MAG: TlpA disulfide reductase family protein [Pseudomonadota bacterium]
MFKNSLILFAGLLLSVCAFAGEDFALPDVDGKLHKLSDYRGQWVVVNYWATWCPPCLEEIPDLEAFHAKHQGKGAVVLGVCMEDIDVKNLREFIDEHFITYTILRGSSKGESPLGPVRGLPSTYLISPEGEIAATHLGRVTGEAIEKFIAEKTLQRQRKAALQNKTAVVQVTPTP